MMQLTWVARKMRHLLILVAFGCIVIAAPARGQSTASLPGAAGAISGRVIDAHHNVPLAGATIALEALGAAGSDASRTALDSLPVRGRTVLTDRSGEYSFTGLRPGVYRVQVRRIGYLPSSVEVDLQSVARSRLSIGLEVEPIALEPVSILGDATQPYIRTGSAAAQRIGARRAVERVRQREYIAADVRAVTAADAKEAVTLGETDLFRTLQRVPGVNTRDDYTALLWTRGASWAQTRIYLDGVPLFNPTHAGWLFAAVNPDAVGSAVFQPGVRSASLGEGAAGTLHLASRSGGAEGTLRGSGELSFATARLALDGEVLGGRAKWMVAGRRTYLDWLTRAVESFGERDSVYVPYNFADLIARVDLDLGKGWTVDASGITELDRLRGDIPGVVGNYARWGNDAGQASLRFPFGPLHGRLMVGGTKSATRVWNREAVDTAGVRVGADPTLPALETLIRHETVGAEIGSRAADAASFGWSAGVQRYTYAVSYDGPYPVSAERIPGFFELPPEFKAQSRLAQRWAQEYGAVWAEGRWAPLQRWDFQAGLRMETGDPVWQASDSSTHRTRLAPRMLLRFRPTAATSLSGGWGRSYQYTQDVGAQAGPLGPQLHLSYVWVAADVARPAIRSDIATLGAEHWITDGWLAAANAYLRRAEGITHPDTASGPIRPTPALFLPAENTAYGLELSARKLVGRWSASAGYAYAVSEMQVGERRFPSSADVRHTVDVMGSVFLTESLRFGGAYSYSRGFPFTRITVPETGLPYLDYPNQERTPNYASLDISLDYLRRFGDWDVNVFLQVRNALGRRNTVTYTGSTCLPLAGSALSSRACSDSDAVRDHFEPGLPRLPLFGIRVAF